LYMEVSGVVYRSSARIIMDVFIIHGDSIKSKPNSLCRIHVLCLIRDPDFPPDFPPGLFPPKLISYSGGIGGDNCYESNFYLSIALPSSIPTSIYTKNVFHQIGP